MFDVAIIGGGVTGCASLFELTNQGYSCVLLEKNENLVAEASSGNSGMLHTGFDVYDGLELECIQNCQSRIYDILHKFRVPVNKIGATIVAWNDDQVKQFPQIIAKSNRAGISDIRELSISELRQREPHLNGNARAALSIPDEAVTDPWLLPVMLAHNAQQKGAKVLLNTRVESCTLDDKSNWSITTTSGTVMAKCVVNCAGLYGDVIERLGQQSSFRILPRKGQYSIYDKTARGLINSSIVPVPSSVGKGVIVFRSVYDNVIVGPTAEDVDSRRRAPIDDVITSRLLDAARQTVKTLDNHNIVGMYTGVRPATDENDYIIQANKHRNWITVGGIRSTGLSGCLGIGDKVRHLVESCLNIEPSKYQNLTFGQPEVKFTRYGTAIIDKTEYKITHPLTIVGTQNKLAQL